VNAGIHGRAGYLVHDPVGHGGDHDVVGRRDPRQLFASRGIDGNAFKSDGLGARQRFLDAIGHRDVKVAAPVKQPSKAEADVPGSNDKDFHGSLFSSG
jgi:hypothetical protein